jgi:hypothetical protein
VLLWLDEPGACLRIAAPPEGRPAPARLRGHLARSRSHTQLNGSAAAAASAVAAAGGGASGDVVSAAWGALCSCGKDDLVLLRQLPLASIVSVRPGTELFAQLPGPGVGAAGSWAHMRAMLAGGGPGSGASGAPGMLEGARSFTIVCTPEAGAAGGSSGSAYNFQVPNTGNGRSRDEWLNALRAAKRDHMV